MSITPSDIEKKTFSTALRGYDLDEVDDFLDEMVAAFRQIQDQLADARARVAELESGAVAAPDPAEPVPDESAVGRALVVAQEAADRIVEEAKAEAERILAEARVEADGFTRERDAKRAEVEAEMAEMTRLVANVRNELAVLATAVADKLDEMDAVVAGSGKQVEPDDEAGGEAEEEAWAEPEDEEQPPDDEGDEAGRDGDAGEHDLTLEGVVDEEESEG